MILLARHRRLDERCQLLVLAGLALASRLSTKWGSTSSAEVLEALADVLVAVLAALLQEDHLVDAGVLELHGQA